MKYLAMALIRIYQRLVSPFLPATCIFTPSCSHYAFEAYARHGFWRGTWLAVRRLVRCWPWSAGGLDPLPLIDSQLEE